MIQIDDNSKVTKNFTVKEVASRGFIFRNEETDIFMDMLQLLRDTSANTYPQFTEDGLIPSNIQRSKSHNKSVGGASNSAHLDGRAADITNINTKDEKLVQWFITAWKIICTMFNKIGGVEIGKDYMHFDNYSDKFGYKRFRIVDKR